MKNMGEKCQSANKVGIISWRWGGMETFLSQNGAGLLALNLLNSNGCA